MFTRQKTREVQADAGLVPAPVKPASDHLGGDHLGADPLTRGTDHIHAAAARGFEGPATELPHAEAIQRSFGQHSVGDVQAHVGGKAAEAAHDMGASAYASGNRVAFSKDPDLHTAAHEAAHIVQQRAGVQLKGGVGEKGDFWERNADEAADRVARGQSAEDVLDKAATRGNLAMGAGVQRKAVQRNEEEEDPVDE